jgi:hypothetical protein
MLTRESDSGSPLPGHMMTSCKSAFAVMLCMQAAACALGDSDHQAGSPGKWEWVFVAGLANPSLSRDADRALTLIADALASEGVRWCAGGSRGFSLNIDSRDLPRGLEIVREVVDRNKLPVHVVEHPQTAAERARSSG